MAEDRPRALVAYDGSEVSKRALQRVARFMSAAEVGLVTVAKPIYRDRRYTGYADPQNEEEQRRVLGIARDILEQAGISPTGFGPVGDPAEEILVTAESFGAELIVMVRAPSVP